MAKKKADNPAGHLKTDAGGRPVTDAGGRLVFTSGDTPPVQQLDPEGTPPTPPTKASGT